MIFDLTKKEIEVLENVILEYQDLVAEAEEKEGECMADWKSAQIADKIRSKLHKGDHTHLGCQCGGTIMVAVPILCWMDVEDSGEIDYEINGFEVVTECLPPEDLMALRFAMCRRCGKEYPVAGSFVEKEEE